MSDEVERFWEAHYHRRRGTYNGKPNALLVEAAAPLSPGTALDLGCGQGGDAIWLAAQGWRVTAVDVSATALELAMEHAAQAGVADAIAWERHDLARSFPAGSFDLVNACYLHSPVTFPREAVLRRAAAAVAPGGTLVIAGHAGPPSWITGDRTHDPRVPLPTPEEVLAQLALARGEWEVTRSGAVICDMLDPEGRPATRPDNVLTVRRLAQNPPPGHGTPA